MVAPSGRGLRMGFRFQRRIKHGGGWGLNTSGSGGSVSYRNRNGSIGTKGFSLRTGIPGLSYRQGWGRNSGAAVAIAVLLFAAAAFAIQLLIYILPLIWQCLVWIVLTVHDLAVYGIQRFKAWRGQSAGRP